SDLSSAPLSGNVTLCTLETMDPNPLATIIVPNVAINGGSLNFATIIPFTKPNNAPTATIEINTSHIGKPTSVYNTPPIIAEHIITVPIDKSIPPVMITNVTPIDKNPI